MLEGKEYLINRMKITVRDIAEKAGVSATSVSLVLNDKPSRITEETKQKIISTAKELGYKQGEKKYLSCK
jgi:LacI family transcriptional regulator